jgi:hypothetical protein
MSVYQSHVNAPDYVGVALNTPIANKIEATMQAMTVADAMQQLQNRAELMQQRKDLHPYQVQSAAQNVEIQKESVRTSAQARRLRESVNKRQEDLHPIIIRQSTADASRAEQIIRHEEDMQPLRIRGQEEVIASSKHTREMQSAANARQEKLFPRVEAEADLSNERLRLQNEDLEASLPQLKKERDLALKRTGIEVQRSRLQMERDKALWNSERLRALEQRAALTEENALLQEQLINRDMLEQKQATIVLDDWRDWAKSEGIEKAFATKNLEEIKRIFIEGEKRFGAGFRFIPEDPVFGFPRIAKMIGDQAQLNTFFRELEAQGLQQDLDYLLDEEADLIEQENNDAAHVSLMMGFDKTRAKDPIYVRETLLSEFRQMTQNLRKQASALPKNSPRRLLLEIKANEFEEALVDFSNKEKPIRTVLKAFVKNAILDPFHIYRTNMEAFKSLKGDYADMELMKTIAGNNPEGLSTSLRSLVGMAANPNVSTEEIADNVYTMLNIPKALSMGVTPKQLMQNAERIVNAKRVRSNLPIKQGRLRQLQTGNTDGIVQNAYPEYSELPSWIRREAERRSENAKAQGQYVPVEATIDWARRRWAQEIEASRQAERNEKREDKVFDANVDMMKTSHEYGLKRVNQGDVLSSEEFRQGRGIESSERMQGREIESNELMQGRGIESSERMQGREIRSDERMQERDLAARQARQEADNAMRADMQNREHKFQASQGVRNFNYDLTLQRDDNMATAYRQYRGLSSEQYMQNQRINAQAAADLRKLQGELVIIDAKGKQRAEEQARSYHYNASLREFQANLDDVLEETTVTYYDEEGGEGHKKSTRRRIHGGRRYKTSEK